MRIITDAQNIDYLEILKRPCEQNIGLREQVSAIISKVKADGDKALKELTSKFDRVELDTIEVDLKALNDSKKHVETELRLAIEVASKNIEQFHAAQRIQDIEVSTMPGVTCKLLYRPLNRVGLYIPSGTAPLISTALMLGVPARVAGCNELIVCTPPPINPSILYACSLINARVFCVGGAQAIAAMAFGTESIPKVDKIFGPGNSFVTEAKMQVAAMGIPIDIPAGPSELLVIADESANPTFIAADLLSQAEHGTDSQVVLISTSQTIIDNTLIELKSQLTELPRKEIAQESLKNSAAIKVDSIERALEISNGYAPEHLILAVNDVSMYVDQVMNAGSIFLGSYTPESVGDYANGTNHTLPTSGFARNWSGVSLNSFTKTITVQEVDKKGIASIGQTVIALAEAEQLNAHANAVKVRLNQLKKNQK
ncbi:MAG: histidinol dehydrogenase [Tenuifilum sp.]|jgi:histidinol dehydrogenase|uniref:histidinol dehydrogenase n=1 Tax=Tenuifilum sp. TaxID=2760880 RepID=UPI0024AA9732|nr:histidinol dehydrogenase [Tenuifilum sp.]MDI3527923.1 histidinol dehydrogenase [Tenuifilum sp.]